MAADNKRPDFRAFTVIKREGVDEDGKPRDFCLNFGVAYRHEDGEGVNILLQALPIDGKLVLRRYKEEKPKSKPTDKGKL